jgi:hypothetical protein
MSRFTMRKLFRKMWNSAEKAAPNCPRTRPSLEVLEDRALPSAPVPQANVYEASPPAALFMQAADSLAASTINQWSHLLGTIQQDMIAEYQLVSQGIAQLVASVEQQVDRFFGINLSTPNQPDSGSDSGSDTTTTAHHNPTQALHNGPQPSGSGSGSAGDG